MHKCIEREEDQETAKPQRNIFKMSRVLVNKKEKKKISKSKQATEELNKLEKNKADMNQDDYLFQKDRLRDQIENSEKEYTYQESSEEDEDSDIEEAKTKIKKP